MKTAIVVGSGAGGAMMARELQGSYQVTVLESGGTFSPFGMNIGRLASWRKTGAFFDDRMIQLLFPQMRIAHVPEMTLVTGRSVGGTTTLATANAIRQDGALRGMGICLDDEFDALQGELPITTGHRGGWSQRTEEIWGIFEEMGLQPRVMPKFMQPHVRCVACGRCVLGCPAGAKWDARSLLDEAVRRGAQIIDRCRVMRLEISCDQVQGVWAIHRGRKQLFRADLVVLAAGGQGTPLILESSGIVSEQAFFADPVLCVAGRLPGASLHRQLPMPFASQQDGYILSPYMDWLSFFFNRGWRMPARDIASIMIKYADTQEGSVGRRGIAKRLTDRDYERMAYGVDQCKEILGRMGVREDEMVLGTMNAGHPGGTFPLTKAEAQTLHSRLLPANCYVADASLLPVAMGNPPMLTIMALAKRIARIVR
ncbi:FAD-dependent oxidoreductase [Denitrobacterium detoxificans]|jgi:choline dehydrogenase-like flavoprotein|uniref:FAD-dependent oxidoreductase n=1 Tax=Denitrobacterium detoxificans TaxID=79604 RepID=UPI0026EA3EF2|nr:FAD-dependent oxidoreductase [Denitrobacterium detoxificans]MBE6466730.1 GMC family oxidoreductase [Denitrobacterium detoxificans]